MSVLVVGISHKSAPVSLLERVALDGDGVHKLIDDVAACEHVTEATVIATCNRLEIYADVDRFHGSVEEVSAAARRARRRGHRGDAPAPLRPLRRRRRLPPLPGGRRARLDGARRGPDPRPDPRRPQRRAGDRHRRSLAQRALPAGAPGRQARPGRDGHRPGRALAGLGRPRPQPHGRRRPDRQAGAGARRRRHGRPRDRDAVAPRRRQRHRRQPHRRQRRPPRRGVRRPLGPAQRPRGRARARRRRRLLHGLDRHHRDRRDGRRPRPPTAASSRSSTSPCRTTSSPRPARCRASR